MSAKEYYCVFGGVERVQEDDGVKTTRELPPVGTILGRFATPEEALGFLNDIALPESQVEFKGGPRVEAAVRALGYMVQEASEHKGMWSASVVHQRVNDVLVLLGGSHP
jgi:hypothetical protein